MLLFGYERFDNHRIDCDWLIPAYNDCEESFYKLRVRMTLKHLFPYCQLIRDLYMILSIISDQGFRTF